MKKSRLILLITLIVPWFTLPLLGSRTIKRFTPAVAFIILITNILQFFAQKLNWWRFYSSIHPKINGSIPFTFGPELIAAYWGLKWAYGKFSLFLLINGIAQLLFAFPTMPFLTQLGISSLERITNFKLFLLLFSRGILMYGFQFFKEKFFSKKLR